MCNVLEILPCLTMGGAENLVKNYLLNYHPQEDIELLCLGGHVHSILEKELDRCANVTYMKEELNLLPIKLPSVLQQKLDSLSWRLWLMRFIRRRSPEVIHCHLSGAYELTNVMSCLKGIRLFYTIHTDPNVLWTNAKVKRETDAIVKLIRELDMQIIVLHEKMVDEVRKFVPRETRIQVLNNAADFDWIRNPRKDRNEMCREFHIPEDSYCVGHIGRFNEPKNHLFLIDVFAAYYRRNAKAQLLLAGDGPLKENAIQHAEALGILDHVHFLGNRRDVPELLAMVDLFLFPSLWEGFPMTLIEAQAAGTKCLVSEIIADEVILTNQIKKCSLDRSAEEWADMIAAWPEVEYKENNLRQYDIHTVLVRLKKIYGLA